MGRAEDGSQRRMRGFEPASSLLRDTIRHAGEGRGFAVARLLTNWAEVVGQDLARACRPVKISYARGGMGATLTLLTTGAAAPMLQMQEPAIRARVNACYGYNAVARITFTQTSATGFAEGQADFGHAPRPPDKAPDPAIAAKAGALASGVADESLRAALDALAVNVISRAGHRKG